MEMCNALARRVEQVRERERERLADVNHERRCDGTGAELAQRDLGHNNILGTGVLGVYWPTSCCQYSISLSGSQSVSHPLSQSWGRLIVIPASSSSVITWIAAVSLPEHASEDLLQCTSDDG